MYKTEPNAWWVMALLAFLLGACSESSSPNTDANQTPDIWAQAPADVPRVATMDSTAVDSGLADTHFGEDSGGEAKDVSGEDISAADADANTPDTPDTLQINDISLDTSPDDLPDADATPPEDIFQPPPKWLAVKVGYGHSLALAGNGSIHCWGQNFSGQCDNIPQGSFLDISAGSYYSCAIDTEMALHCWGKDHHGETNAPEGKFSFIGTGFGHICAMEAGTGKVQCIGDDSLGQISQTPSDAFVQLSVGGYHACAFTEVPGPITCWGHNNNGQSSPPEGDFKSLHLGEIHSCAIKASATEGETNVACWGINDFEMLTPPSLHFETLDGGHTRTCGITLAGQIECWGSQGTAPPTGTFTQISVGPNHACAIGADEEIQCWGQSQFGETDAP